MIRETHPAPTAETINIGGFTPLTTIDYPDHLSAVVFLQACPWRCAYCQNSTLLGKKPHQTVSWASILGQLQQRRGFLDAVVFSGGEATLQKALPQAIQQVKALGFKIGLHTAGIYPKRLEKLLPLLDRVALDIKTTFADYPKLTGDKQAASKVQQSIKHILASGINAEFRTTVHPDLLNQAQLLQLLSEAAQSGIKTIRLQACQYQHCMDKTLQQVDNPYTLSHFIQRNASQLRNLSIKACI